MNNCILNKNKNILKKPKTKKNIVFTNPVSIIKENNGGFVTIEIACDTDEYNKGEKYKVHTNLLNKCKKSTWNKIIDSWINKIK